MSNPKISVIVPVYNVELYLPRCINSILAQTFTDFELLLIDDGSKDKSGEICDEYAKKDNRIRVFHKENGGVSSARNLGIDNARGKWINFVDSDDWVESDLYSNIMHIIEENNIDLVCWNYFIDKDKQSTPIAYIDEDLSIKNNDEIIHLLRKAIYGSYNKYIHMPDYNMIFLCNKIYKTDLLKAADIRFNQTLVRAEDALFNIMYLKQVSHVAITNKCFYHYVMRESSVMHWQDKSLFIKLYQSLNAIKNNIDLNDSISVQCFLGRIVGYINEYFSLYLCDPKMSLSELKKNLSLISEITDALPITLQYGNVLERYSRIMSYLIRHRFYNMQVFLLFIRRYIKSSISFMRLLR